MKGIKSVTPPGITFHIFIQKSIRKARVRFQGTFILPFFKIVKTWIQSWSTKSKWLDKRRNRTKRPLNLLFTISVIYTKPKDLKCSNFIEYLINGVKVFLSIVKVTDAVLDDDETLFFRTEARLSCIGPIICVSFVGFFRSYR